MEEKMTTGRKLYLLRSRLNLSLDQAADIIGVSKSTLCRYEKDECHCHSAEVWQRIFRLYQVHPHYFEEEQDPAEDEFAVWEETEVLQAWRRADLRTKLRVRRILDAGIP